MSNIPMIEGISYTLHLAMYLYLGIAVQIYNNNNNNNNQWTKALIKYKTFSSKIVI